MHGKLTVSQCVVKTTNKHFVPHTWLVVLVATSRHAIPRPAPVAELILLGHPVAISHDSSLFFVAEVTSIVSSTVLATSVVLMTHLHLTLAVVTELLLARGNLVEERVGWFIAISFTDLDFSVLDDMWGLGVEQCLLEGVQRLDTVGLERDKSETATPACILVPHYRHIDDFSKLGKIIFDIDL